MAKPIVDGLEKDLANEADVLRLDVVSSLGRHTALYYGVRGTPTLVVVNPDGELVLSQVGIIRAAEVKAVVAEIVHDN